jgi:hypothetical protein
VITSHGHMITDRVRMQEGFAVARG